MFPIHELWLDTLPSLMGLGAGLIFGWLVVKANYCALGAFTDIVLFRQPERLYLWVFSMMVALAVTSFLTWQGMIDVSQTAYLIDSVSVGRYVFGGICFGLGMVMASGCMVKNITRIGSGNLKSLVVIVFAALAAQTTFSGRVSPIRFFLRESVVLPIHQLVADPVILMFVGILGALFFLFKGMKVGQRPKRMWVWGALIGLMIPMWWLSSTLYLNESAKYRMGFDEVISSAPTSLSYIYPLTQVLDWFHTLWGTVLNHTYAFSLTLILGTIVGAYIAYGPTHFQVSGFQDTKDLSRHIIGGLLMGFGGAIAGGCTVGQGLTGFSTGSIGALLTILSIGLTAILFLYYQSR